jgi:bacteriocin biosynthesis cyclodehydratase domain-containing protein
LTTVIAASNALLPEYPRLRTGCVVFDDGDGCIVRSLRGAFRIPAAHRDAMRRVLGQLDGRHDFASLLGNERSAEAFYALGVLDGLARRGFLADGAVGARPPARPADRAAQAPLSGADIRFDDIDRSALARAIARRLAACGARVTEGTAGAGPESALHITCLDRPDIARLGAANRVVRKAGRRWLPIFPLGDAIVIGPHVARSGGACLRCFHLRRFGIAPSIGAERSYFEFLRRRGEDAGAAFIAASAKVLAERITELLGVFLAETPATNTVFTLDLEDGTASEAWLERHPQCEVCARASRPAHELTGADWFEDALHLTVLGADIERLESDLCGLVSIVDLPRGPSVVREADLPNIAVGRFALPEFDNVGGEQDNWCHGSAKRAEDARTLAMIEALERYSGLAEPRSDVHASYASLAERATCPADLVLFSAAQYAQADFPFEPFDPESNVHWSTAYNVTQKRNTLVPATAAWYGRDDALLGETSSGVAAHSGRADALYNGALELIERDAFMIFWLQRLSAPLVDVRCIDDVACIAMIRSLEESGYTVHIADLTTDLDVPVYLSMGIRDDGQKPALLCGAAASLDPTVAIARSLAELHAADASTTAFWTLQPPLAATDVLRLEDHYQAYQHPEWLDRAAFLWASSSRVRVSPAGSPVSLDALIALLADRGHDLIGVDITPPDVARYHVRVVRAIIPGLQPLGFGRRIRLGGRRLYEAPRRMGYGRVAASDADLNPFPHCFP